MKEEDQPQANRTYALYPSEASQLLWALRIGMSVPAYWRKIAMTPILGIPS